MFLVHPGGPFWAHKDDGAWSIPKGEFDPAEDPLAAARREFTEETGFPAPDGEPIALTPLKQPSGKVVHAWAVRGDCDPPLVRSNTFTFKGREFPEVDRAGWFAVATARGKMLVGQRGFVEELERLVNPGAPPRV